MENRSRVEQCSKWDTFLSPPTSRRTSFEIGDTLRAIKAQLEAEQVPYITGEVAWNISTLQSILQNEKYCGDVIMQKTFRKDCISKETVVNTGHLPKYWAQNHCQRQ